VGTSPEKGAKTAKVTIVEFSDFQCPFCSRVEPTMDQVRSTYGPDKVRCELAAGSHSGPSGRFGHLGYEAEVLAWVLDRLGV